MSKLLDYFIAEGMFGDRNITAPVSCYSDAEAEYDLILHGVAFRDLSDYTFLKLSGKDAQDFLHRITTNDLKNLDSMKLQNTVFCNERGRIIDRVQIIKTEDSIWLLGNRNHDDLLYRWLNKYIIADDVSVHKDESLTVIEILGAQCEAYINYKFGDAASLLEENACAEVEWENHFYLLIKISEPLKGTYFKLIATTAAQKYLVSDSIQAGFIFQSGLVGEAAYERFRIEKGILSVNELNDDFNPHEAGIIGDVSFTKGCYIGQEVIARLDTYDKVQKQIRKISIEGKLNGSSGREIKDPDGNDAGTITSVYFVDKENRTIALAYIRKQYLDGLTKLAAFAGDEARTVRFRNY